MLKPGRRRGFEYLDDPNIPANVAAHSLRDIALANSWFGGTRAILSEMRPIFRELQREGGHRLSMLDIGTGLGDIPREVETFAVRSGLCVDAIGLELTRAFAAVSHKRLALVIAGDARQLPLADNSVDVVTCSLVLHHLPDNDAIHMLRECDRVARRRVIVAELTRSWLAMALIWLVSFPLGFHPISRHDGVVSIRRGFLSAELRAMIARVTVAPVECRNRLGWRVTASWQPGTNRT